MDTRVKGRDGQRLLRVQDAAAMLAVSKRKVWRLLGTRELPAVRVGRRGTRIREADLAAFVANLQAAREVVGG